MKTGLGQRGRRGPSTGRPPRIKETNAGTPALHAPYMVGDMPRGRRVEMAVDKVECYAYLRRNVGRGTKPLAAYLVRPLHLTDPTGRGNDLAESLPTGGSFPSPEDFVLGKKGGIGIDG